MVDRLFDDSCAIDGLSGMMTQEEAALERLLACLDKWGERQEVVLSHGIEKIQSMISVNLRLGTCANLGSLRSSSSQTLPEEDASGTRERVARVDKNLTQRVASKGAPATTKVKSGVQQNWIDQQMRATIYPAWMLRAMDFWNGLLTRQTQRCLESSTPATGYVAQALTSKTFEILTAMVIISNAIFIATSTDEAVIASLHDTDGYTETTWALELFFGTFYTLELMGRIYIYRVQFFITPDWRWNLLDSLLVCLVFEDQISYLVGADKANLSFVRLIRITKLLKTLRIVKILRVFRELRLIVNSVVGSLYSMVWASMLILIVMFGFGILTTQGCTSFLRDYPADKYPEMEHERITFVYYWGSVSTSMSSLYMAALGGENWRFMCDTLSGAGVLFRLLFFGFIAFFSLVIVNTLTSLFVESTIQFAEKNNQVAIKDEMDKKFDYVNKLKELFQRIDADGNGVLSYDELMDALGESHMLAFLATAEIDVHDAVAFFREISFDGDVDVDLNTFVLNCLKLKGSARSLDLLGFIGTQRTAMTKLQSDMAEMHRLVKLVAVRQKTSVAVMPPKVGPISSVEQVAFDV